MYNKKYFLGFSDHWVGPYTINELRDLPLAKTNKIWTEGLKEWADIESVDELRGLINLIPPPLTSYDEKQRREDYKIDSVVRDLDDVCGRYEKYTYLFQYFSVALLIVSIVAGGFCIFAGVTGSQFWTCVGISFVALVLSFVLMFFSVKNGQKYADTKRRVGRVVMVGSENHNEVINIIDDEWIYRKKNNR